MKNEHCSATTITQQTIWNKLLAILFFLIIVVDIITTYHVTGNYIDSDASSELVLAHQLSQTGQILSQDWFYSTELRILNTQLVYAPLFLIFDSWHMVRFFGAVILQAIMLLSFGYLSKSANLPRNTFFLSASLLLLPVSVSYGRIVLYHCFYIPHIALSFFLVGLLLKFVDKPDWKRPVYYLRLILLAVFSFLGGLGGIRQLMITHAPVLLAIVVLGLLEDHEEVSKATIFSGEKMPLTICSILSAAASFVGMKCNTTVLARMYSFEKQADNQLYFLEASELNDVLDGFFHQFGFRKNVSLISLEGILSLSGIVAGILFLIVVVRNLLRHRKGMDFKKAIVTAMPLFYTAIMVAVFCITSGKNPYHYPLYLTFCLSWAAPLMVLHMQEVSPKIHPFHSRRLFSWLAVAILFANGLVNVLFFNGSKFIQQPYEGLTFQEMDIKEKMSNVCAFLVEQDYDIGYAPFWQGNITTESTNGKIRIRNILLDKENGNLSYYNWLTSHYLREVESEKPFLLIKSQYQPIFELSDSFPLCRLVYDDSIYCVYDISDEDAFRSLLRY